MTESGTPPLLIEQVLDEEYAFLHAPPDAPASPQAAALTPVEIVRRHARANHAALCLSGGGVRSGSFGLGVLQGLARAGVLGKFDYLSTVSGGGYIGGWLTAWRVHARERGEVDPSEQLGRDIEPDPITRLRSVIKFLDPRTGLLSVDVWTLGGTMFRNLLVNWMVLVPLIATAAMLPRIYLGLLGLPSQPELVSPATLDWWYVNDWIPIVVLIAIATTFAAVQLPSLGHRAAGSRGFAIWFLAPVLLVLFLFSVHRFWAWHFGDDVSLGIELLISIAAMVLPWIIGGAFSDRWWRPWTWIAAAAAGLVGRLVASWAHHFLTALARHDPQVFVVIDLPTSLVLLFLQIAVFIGLASRDMSDDDREWWARAGAWILIIGLSWLVAAAIAILGPLALDAGLDALGFSHGGGRVGLGLFTILSGGAAYRMIAALASQARRWRFATGLALCLAAPVTTVLLDRPGLGRQPAAASVHSRPPPLSRAPAPGGRVAARGSSCVLRPARHRHRSRARHLDQSVLAARDVSEPARAHVPGRRRVRRTTATRAPSRDSTRPTTCRSAACRTWVVRCTSSTPR